MSRLIRILDLRSGNGLDRALVGGAMLAALTIVTTTIVAVAWYFHPVVYRDMWYMFDLLRTSPWEGAFWEAVWLPWSDHRIVFPKLLYALDFRLAGGTGALLVFLSLACQAGVAWILGVAARRQAGLEAHDKRVFVAVAWIACFWLVQSGNLLWGFQVAWFLNALAIAAAILLLADPGRDEVWNRARILRAVSAMLLVTVATFSLANGLLMWGVLGFLLWKDGAPRGLQGVWWACAILATWGALAATGEGTSSGLFTLRYIPFFLALLGSPFSRIHLEAGIVLGALGFLAFMVFALRFLAGRKQGVFFTFAFAQTSYVMLSAWVITAGRAYKGVEQATTSRYYPPLLLFWCLLFCLAWLATRRLRVGAWLRAGLAVSALAVVGAGQLASLPERAERSLKADLARLALAANVGDSATLEYVNMFPGSAAFWREAAFVKSRNLSLYHRAPWLRTHDAHFSGAYRIDEKKVVSASFETRELVTLPGRPGAFLQGRFDPAAAGHPTGIVAVRAGRVAGFAGMRRRGCAGCFSGFVSAPGPDETDDEISLYAIYGGDHPLARRLVTERAAQR